VETERIVYGNAEGGTVSSKQDGGTVNVSTCTNEPRARNLLLCRCWNCNDQSDHDAFLTSICLLLLPDTVTTGNVMLNDSL